MLQRTAKCPGSVGMVETLNLHLCHKLQAYPQSVQDRGETEAYAWSAMDREEVEHLPQAMAR